MPVRSVCHIIMSLPYHYANPELIGDHFPDVTYLSYFVRLEAQLSVAGGHIELYEKMRSETTGKGREQ